MQANRRLYQPFIKHIPPFVVDQLMQDDKLEIFSWNIRAWQYDARMKEANQQRRGNQRIDTQLYRSFHACLLRKCGKPV